MPLEFEKPILELERRIAELKETAKATGVDLEAEIRLLEERLARLRKETYENLTPWQRVQLARAPGRPTTLDVLEKAFQDFIRSTDMRAVRNFLGCCCFVSMRRLPFSMHLTSNGN